MLVGVRKALGSEFDILTRQYAALSNFNGGGVSRSSLQIFDQYWVRPCRAAGLIGVAGPLLRVNPCLGVNAAALLTPAITISGASIDVGHGTLTYSEATGIQTDGTTGYVDTTAVPYVPTGGAFVYLRTSQSAVSATIPIGAINAGSTQVYWIRNLTAARYDAEWGTTTDALLSGGTQLTAAGYQVIRRNSTSLVLYRNGIQTVNSATSTTPTAITQTLYTHALNNNGTAANFTNTNTQIAGYSIDDGTMTAAQSLLYYQIWQRFQTAMQRNV